MMKKENTESKHYLLAFEKGDIYELKPAVVKKLITDDAELFNEFQNDSEYNQNRDQRTYIKRYNERHVQK